MSGPLKKWRIREDGLTRLLPEHNPSPISRCRKRPQRRLRPSPDLPSASGPAKLLDAVGVHRRPRAPVPQIAAARAERVWSLHADIARIEREGIAAFDAVPLERLQEELRHDRIALIGIEDINVDGPKPGALVHPLRSPVSPVLDLLQIGLRAALPEAMLGVI